MAGSFPESELGLARKVTAAGQLAAYLSCASLLSHLILVFAFAVRRYLAFFLLASFPNLTSDGMAESKVHHYKNKNSHGQEKMRHQPRTM